MELKLDRQNLRGLKRAHTLNFYTCSGRFPVMVTIKEVCPNAAVVFNIGVLSTIIVYAVTGS